MFSRKRARQHLDGILAVEHTQLSQGGFQAARQHFQTFAVEARDIGRTLVGAGNALKQRRVLKISEPQTEIAPGLGYLRRARVERRSGGAAARRRSPHGYVGAGDAR